MNIFEAIEVEKQYAGHKALDKVSISVPEQSIFGLLGPNGAGKTTLIRIINQITAPDEGKLTFKGNKLSSNHIHNIGYLPEERGLYKKMKVGEQALYLARLKGLSRMDALKKLKYWFEKFEIQGWWDKKIEELSKGMQQKVQFIVTILHEPELLIFDEPFSGFDPINANLLKQEILELNKKGATIIFSTHNMGSVEEICNNISLINKSKNILSGTISEVRKKYKSNQYEVIFEGNTESLGEKLNEKYELLHLENKNGVKSAIIKGKEEVEKNELLQILLPHIHIVSYREIIPSMNDIFIRVVEKFNSTQTT